MEKRVENASDEINKDDLKLAKDFLKFQKKAQKDLKDFL